MKKREGDCFPEHEAAGNWGALLSGHVGVVEPGSVSAARVLGPFGCFRDPERLQCLLREGPAGV